MEQSSARRGGSGAARPPALVQHRSLRAVVDDRQVRRDLAAAAETVAYAVDRYRFNTELSRDDLTELEADVMDSLQSAVLELEHRRELS